jgi:hypothetical protein
MMERGEVVALWAVNALNTRASARAAFNRLVRGCAICRPSGLVQQPVPDGSIPLKLG